MLPAGSKLGSYAILGTLGQGGMATIYLADDAKHRRKVAIKVLHAETAAAIGQDRFLREIEIAARLTHPHILPLHDSGAADGQLYYVMPYIGGESLRARLDRDKYLPLDDALRLTREIASALGHAHHQGLVHRDIKPENILLADDMALVADFGIARMHGEPIDVQPSEAARTRDPRDHVQMTRAGMTLGSPRYMAPEQAAGSDSVDGRADLYSLGCVLHELLAGEPPFAGSSVESLAYQHSCVEPPSVATLRPSVPLDVAAAIAKALAKNPGDRYATAARFAEALTLAMSKGPTSAHVPAPEAASVPNNIPRQRTSFIGREKELEEGVRLMRGETRLLTLAGIGGCGKTRLALELADDLLDTFPDGVWFVDLAPLRDAQRVTLTLASALGLREETGTPLIETLARSLRENRTLIIMDNCEHVLRTTAELVDRLLSSTRQLKVIATSRESLTLAGERPLVIPPLSVPEAGKERDVRAILASESARLFVDRARLTDATFELDAKSGPALAEICRRLDGIPLAIELAAARARLLSVEEIRARLDDMFRLLTSSSRAVPRHQTLRAMIGWSYDQLGHEEQSLFRLLSVFAGGWTMEAATRLAGTETDEFQVLEVLGRLLDKSLLVVGRLIDGTSRYTMLETVRQYAQERLVGSGEANEAHTRHLGFYLALAENAERMIFGPEQGAVFARLDRERENLLSAHRWCDHDEGFAQDGLRLVYAMQRYWLPRGLLDLGRQTTLEALRRPGAQERSVLRCRALFAVGQLCYFMGRYEESEGHLEQSLSIAREIGEGARIATVLILLGNAFHGKRDLVAAREHLEEALALAREGEHRPQIMAALNALAEVYRSEGAVNTAGPLYEEALALGREHGNRSSIANCLCNLAIVAISEGALDRARPMILEALEIAEEVGSKQVGLLVLDVCVGLAVSLGDWERAEEYWGTSEAQMEAIGLRRSPADQAFVAPLIARAREHKEEASINDALAAGRERSYGDAMSDVREWLQGRGR
jgi:predicted ATPase/tRNA A-37 threonylcarbamoyl transferase component Bud32